MNITNNIVNPIERKKAQYQGWIKENIDFLKLAIEGLCAASDDCKDTKDFMEFTVSMDALEELIKKSLDEEIDQLYFARPSRREFNNWVAWKVKENREAYFEVPDFE